MIVVQNEDMLDLMRQRYTLPQIEAIHQVLSQHGTFDFCPLQNGLFSAALVNEETAYTGYSAVWIRDNMFVAWAHYITGCEEAALKNLDALFNYLDVHRTRFERVIASPDLAEDVMERPHIRFDGETLQEFSYPWSHAQNDALGYFLWLYCLALKDSLARNTAFSKSICEKLDLLVLFPMYFDAVAYWADEDNGHWEEEQKIEASSIGVVVAALKVLKELLVMLPEETAACLTYNSTQVDAAFIDTLIEKGKNALNEILPFECIQPAPQFRKYDAALLFLIYPLNVIDGDLADQVLHNVVEHLQGPFGIRRYLNDSFWAADYRTRMAPEKRTMDFSDDMTYRDSLIKEGEEAQWCIFDPIVSCIYGEKYQQHGREEDLNLQVHYLNRSLGQLTGKESSVGPYKSPELYFLEEGEYVHNDSTPLLWAQSNLMIALDMMRKSLGVQ